MIHLQKGNETAKLYLSLINNTIGFFYEEAWKDMSYSYYYMCVLVSDIIILIINSGEKINN